MAEDKVRKALALLEQAGHMDIVRQEALGPLCLPRRASAGVAAAGMACSPPRTTRMVSPQVRRGGRGKGGPWRKGAAWAAGGACEVGPAGAGPKGNPRRPEVYRGRSEVGGGGKGAESGAACATPTEGGRGGGKSRQGCDIKGTVRQLEKGGVELGGLGFGRGARRAVAAREPWWEEKAGPGAACRMASAGVRRRRRKAADASAERCGSTGFAPAEAAAQGEQRPGPSGIEKSIADFSDGCDGEIV
ncbi:hypothetical protein NDU88_005169 [Pleurodeles waltl]|uniref:Uncharacterized protein n=1 Tax=Pleurodeles waltl TaxID=8319 RepID=A0AAV7PLV7_PLEWA|nr:hypothetical protein NDU88_005169 [Pleurodeles waltl]